MTDLVITAANVVAGANAKKETGIAGATITAGQLVYKDTTSKKFLVTDADGAAAVRNPLGMALNNASLNQPLTIVKEGDINPGATVVVGGIYVASDTPGGVMPVADLEIGDYVTIVGIGTSATNIKMKIVTSDVAVAA